MQLLGLMFFGLASLQIYNATFFSAVPAFFLIALAGVFSMPLITEVEMGRGVLQFGLTALFGVLTSGLAVVAPYLFLFGWYPFLKFLLD
ncbi:MAG: hypothetical protein IJN00_06225, partial [Clostridia bacterium]|nr:hypothetical protein [Clostridia bacterium]